MKPTAIIRHPNNPERFVEVRKLNRSEEYDIDVARASLSQPVAIVDPISGEYVRLGADGKPDSKGELQVTMVRRPPPLALLCREKAVQISRWGGVVDADGAVVECKPANMVHLYERWNDVTLPDGKVMSFARFIDDRLDEPNLFDADPSGNS